MTITNLPPLTGTPEQIDTGTVVRYRVIAELDEWLAARASYGPDYVTEIERIRPLMHAAIVRETDGEIWSLYKHSGTVQALLYDLMTEDENNQVDAIRADLHGATVTEQVAKIQAIVAAR